MERESTESVSVIIPTYNRMSFLLHAIQSIKNQTYPNIEIIVINDCSTEPEYYTYNFNADGVTVIHLAENSKQKFGYACAGYVRTLGMKIATGDYIAFLDDDDIWINPAKLSDQILAMKTTGCKMCCTDGFIGQGLYNRNMKYPRLNAEYYYNILQEIFNANNSDMIKSGFPKIWKKDLIQIHNCCITSSMIIEKTILEKIGYMQNVRNGQEDKTCWLKALEYTDCVYLDNVYFYYDFGHGYGWNYEPL
jgi:glycosyltransferase involved in cell wall biosynthesis